jgi:histidyl-tRNA synthetase
MAKQDISVLSGMRDFSPEEVFRREYIFHTIKTVFKKYGFVPIETPAIERLSVLSGKYGEEGDKLLFNVFNSGSADEWKDGTFTPDKALRYDLTVPFARYVVNHRNDLTMPFKRYQIQSVWRGDRPQKGRYREFTQCDADIIGSDSLLNEAELILIYHEALSMLGIRNFKIHFNNRKILNGLAEWLGMPEKFTDLCIALDKWDKIGKAGVQKELLNRNFPNALSNQLLDILDQPLGIEQKLELLQKMFVTSTEGQKGISETESILKYLKRYGFIPDNLILDLTLARGLDYYTGAIFEVTVQNAGVGSIGGGGRYDNLTDTFGLKNVTGVGISFGADRIYDVMNEQGLFQNLSVNPTKVLLINFDEDCLESVLKMASELRTHGVACEVYPQTTKKLDKQFSYADKKGIPFVFIIGSEEMEQGTVKIKYLASGEQSTHLRATVIPYIIQQIQDLNL